MVNDYRHKDRLNIGVYFNPLHVTYFVCSKCQMKLNTILKVKLVYRHAKCFTK